MEKADLNSTAADVVTGWQYNLEQSFSAFRNAADAAAKEQQAAEIELLGCSALKASEIDLAEQCFMLIVSDTCIGKKTKVRFIQGMLTAAARARQDALFLKWLQFSENIIKSAVVEQAELVLEFLKSVAFIICDRRYQQGFTALRNILYEFFYHTKNKNILSELINEWTILTAQISKRQWFDVTDFLLRSICYAVLKKADLYFVKVLLLQISIHYAMYSRWDGFANAFKVYKNLQIFILLLIKKAGDTKIDYYTRKQYLLVALRSVRDLIANISRTSMQDDLQVIRQWNDLLLADQSGSSSSRKCFMQLVIAYWCQTKPKTSRKQLKYLTDLLEEDLLSDEYKKMLQEIA